MITATQLKSLKVGDTFETEGPFGGLTEEKMTWECTLINRYEQNDTSYKFKVRYLGATVVEEAWANVHKGKITVMTNE